jgi:hypothetical protein
VSVKILWISQDTRTITLLHCPQSQRELIDAICAYWKEHELPWSITEVLRFPKPQRVFYSVHWTEGEADDD